jgi:hypothetical protein
MKLYANTLVRALVAPTLLSLAATVGAQQTFTPSADGLTVTDAISGLQTLQWQRCAEGMSWNGATCTGSPAALTWVQSLMAVNAANRAQRNGFSDWYLPPVGELSRLWRSAPPVGVPAEFAGTPGVPFFSSTAVAFGSVIFNALGTNFANGNVVSIVFPVQNTDTYAARLVRAPGAAYHSVTGVIQPAAAANWVAGDTFSAPTQGSVFMDYTLTPGWRFTNASVTGNFGPSCASGHVTAPASGVVVALLQSNCTATLTFERIIWPVTVTQPPASEGSIQCPATVNEGDALVCTVSAQPGYQLPAWGDDCAASAANATCAMANVARAQTVSASFALAPARITVVPPPAGQGTISCPATVPMGGTLHCTAAAGAGYAFQAWGDDCAASGNLPSCSVAAVARDQTVSARFVQIAPVAVPTLGEWGLALTGLLAAALGARRLRWRGRR